MDGVRRGSCRSVLDLLFHPLTETLVGPIRRIDCPACGGRQVESTPRQISETMPYILIVTRQKRTTVMLRCSVCREDLISTSKSLDAFYAMDDVAASQTLRHYAPLAGRVLVVISLVCVWMPFIMMPVSLAGMLLVRRHRRWRRIAAAPVIVQCVIFPMILGYNLLVRGA
jgi:hypothetical protein